MDLLDKRRWEHALKTLELARNSEAEKPDLSVSWYGSAYQLMASVKSNEGLESEVRDILNEYVEVVTPTLLNGKVQVTLQKQNDLLFIAGYVNNLEAAEKLISINVDAAEEHGFIQCVNYFFRLCLHAPCNIKPLYEPDKAEEHLFKQFSSIVAGKGLDVSAVDKFWRATKNKRYKNTLWGNINLFSVSLKNYSNEFTV